MRLTLNAVLLFQACCTAAVARRTQPFLVWRDPLWLRYRFSPPTREPMPVFLPFSTPAWLLTVLDECDRVELWTAPVMQTGHRPDATSRGIVGAGWGDLAARQALEERRGWQGYVTNPPHAAGGPSAGGRLSSARAA
jgi:hypothetical protein